MMMIHYVILALLVSASVNADSVEPIIGGPCQGCELVFVDMPEQLEPKGRITALSEPGESMRLTGTVYNIDGTVASGLIVYAYQTNNDGIYPADKTVHGALRSWAKTDGEGQYSFDTIRPKPYPNRDIPEHIHLHVIEPNKGTYYIDSVEFTDDPLLVQHPKEKRLCRGGCGIATPQKDNQGNWLVTRDIFLGRGIADYEFGE